MTYRPHPKYASNDARKGPWSTCDRCGFIWSQSDLQWQYQFQGGSVPQRTGFLHCPLCLDGLDYQNQLIIIPPDPPPIFNLRVENYTVDETNWLVTEDSEILETPDGDQIITNIPNPGDDANTVLISSAISAPGGSVSVLYLDLYDGDPTAGGYSILTAVTGSATRSDIAADVEANDFGSGALNPEVIAIATASASTVNITHVAFYSAATGGIRLMSGAASTAYPTIAAGMAVSLAAGGLVISLL